VGEGRLSYPESGGSAGTCARGEGVVRTAAHGGCGGWRTSEAVATHPSGQEDFSVDRRTSVQTKSEGKEAFYSRACWGRMGWLGQAAARAGSAWRARRSAHARAQRHNKGASGSGLAWRQHRGVFVRMPALSGELDRGVCNDMASR
jgi:hypothetical protein